jgi:hypothetical protein
MFMRSACVAIGLFGGVAVARAEWQPVEAPPVPPETENAQRGRAAPAARTGPQPAPAIGSRAEPAPEIGSPTRADPAPASDEAGAPQPKAAIGSHAPGEGSSSWQAHAPVDSAAPLTAASLPAGGSSASESSGGAQPQPSAAPARADSARGVELAQASPARKRSDGDALQAFPPAPPPVVPGAAPEQPTTALTSFAPAPVPTPRPTALEPTSAAAPKPNAPPAAPLPAVAAAPQPNITPADEPPTGAEPLAAAGGIPPAPQPTELWSAAALLGIGATFDNTVAGVNPLGFGFGVRGDYRIHPMWSLGARMLYFVGGSVELPTHDVVMQSWLLAAEGAYVLDLDPLTIQPGVALGLFVRETNYRGYAPFITEDPTSVSQPDTTRLFFYIAPGLNVSLPLALASPALAPLTVGADVRLDVGFGRRVTGSIQLLGQVGLRF